MGTLVYGFVKKKNQYWNELISPSSSKIIIIIRDDTVNRYVIIKELQECGTNHSGAWVSRNKSQICWKLTNILKIWNQGNYDKDHKAINCIQWVEKYHHLRTKGLSRRLQHNTCLIIAMCETVLQCQDLL